MFCGLCCQVIDYFLGAQFRTSLQGKRFFELLNLATLADCSAVCVHPRDADLAADLWPVGPGTQQALTLVFECIGTSKTPRNQRKCREGIRVLQRLLGGGTRWAPFKNISALLCFWKMNKQGRMKTNPVFAWECCLLMHCRQVGCGRPISWLRPQVCLPCSFFLFYTFGLGAAAAEAVGFVFVCAWLRPSSGCGRLLKVGHVRTLYRCFACLALRTT